MIDLRSDTVTQPTTAMLKAMMSAKVGDDVFNEDPTVKELQQFAAELLGMEDALFCPSGTMCNQIAIKTHTQPLDEIICDGFSHIYNYENGMWAMASGVSLKLIKTDNGIINSALVKPNIQPDFDWLPATKLVVIENTCNRAGGTIYPLDTMRQLSNTCKENQLKFHLDGARLFNAIAASDYTVNDLHGLFDSVSICLSKGLGAPVGSLLLGSKAFIKRARKFRKAFGGGMRQVGFLAAAGLYALKNNVNRLAIDNKNAQTLANSLSKAPSVKKVLPVATNIVIYELNDSVDPTQYTLRLSSSGIKAIAFGNMVRLVTHLGITDPDIENTCKVLSIN